MTIQQALEAKVGQIVYCPADRNDPAYYGKTVHVGDTAYTSHQGQMYTWITVRKDHINCVWPSNRLNTKRR